MIANGDCSDEARACPYIDVPPQPRNPARSCANSDLLKKQAIRTDFRVRMNYDPIRMRDQ